MGERGERSALSGSQWFLPWLPYPERQGGPCVLGVGSLTVLVMSPILPTVTTDHIHSVKLNTQICCPRGSEASCACAPLDTSRGHLPWTPPMEVTRSPEATQKLDHSTLTRQPSMQKCSNLGGENMQFGNGNLFELA